MLEIKKNKQTDKTKQSKRTKQQNTLNNIIMCHKTCPRNACILGFISRTKIFACFLQFIPYSLLLQELDIKNLRELEVMCIV